MYEIRERAVVEGSQGGKARQNDVWDWGGSGIKTTGCSNIDEDNHTSKLISWQYLHPWI